MHGLHVDEEVSEICEDLQNFITKIYFQGKT